MVQVTVAKWGDSLAVQIPGEIAQLSQLHDGAQVEVFTRDQEIVIRQLDPDAVWAKLFEGKTPAEWHAEYAAAFDWGPDVGREIVDE